MPARTPPSLPAASTGPASNNVVPFPARGRARKSRAPVADAANDSTTAPAGGPARVIVLPAARPAPPPDPPRARARKEQEAYCSACEACVAYPALDSAAKLSRHNRQEIDGDRYCYGGLSRIADERTRTIAGRRNTETSAASRYSDRRSEPAAAGPAPASSRPNQTKAGGPR